MKLIWILLVVSPALINAQYTITGTVTNAESEPLKFVRVMISAKESESLIGYTFTDDIGEYSMEIPSNAELMITFSATYYTEVCHFDESGIDYQRLTGYALHPFLGVPRHFQG